MFFISDTHWGHKNIIKYSNRPFKSVEEMNHTLIANWNKVVGPKDEVWHLGDFAFMKYEDLKNVVRQLNGIKRLILGNHDKTIILNRDNFLKSGLFASIQNYAEVHTERQMIVLFHYGMRTWNKAHHSSIHLYGHSHGGLPPFGRSVDVGVDCKEITPEYRPVSIDEVFHYMKDKVYVPVDHHGD